jgi:hypothetical protein
MGSLEYLLETRFALYLLDQLLFVLPGFALFQEFAHDSEAERKATKL